MTDKQFLIALGKNISRIRKEKGIKQIDFWHQCDIEKSNLIRIEKGRTNPTALTLRKISKTLKTPVKILFEDLE